MKKILSIIALSCLSVIAHAADPELQLGKTYTGSLLSTGGCINTQYLHFTNTQALDLLQYKVTMHGYNRGNDITDLYMDTPLYVRAYKGSIIDDANRILQGWEGDSVATIKAAGNELTFMITDNQCLPTSQTIIYDITLDAPKPTVTVTGKVINGTGVPVENVQINFYLPDGKWFAGTKTNLLGNYAVGLPKDGYLVEAVNLSGTAVFNGNVPKDKASRVVVKTGTKLNITLNDIKPVVETVTPATVETKTGYIITGTGFGTARGYVDIGGYLTNSTSYIKSWTDTEISLVKSSSMQVSGCFKIFAKYAGYSDCLNF